MQDPSMSSDPPEMLMNQMEAGAFRELCLHLRERSDEVQNIELMTLGGFCRNCLAKWMVLEARELSETLKAGSPSAFRFFNEKQKSSLMQQLDSFGYDDAAQDVYGCMYSEWKTRHQTKATESQIRLYKASMPIHASHNEEILKKKSNSTCIGDCQIYQDILTHLQSGAFRRLCQHLRERSNEVQNIDLMALSGFCRNCLAKWLVIQARKISDEIQNQLEEDILDAYSYDKAARAVYGCGYEDWKKRHQKKATAEQIERFNSSKDLHAIHNKELLAPRIVSVPHNRGDSTNNNSAKNTSCMQESSKKVPLLSNVCCENVETILSSKQDTKQCGELAPPSESIILRIAILTISDRAAANKYATGDLSGPAVKETIARKTDEINAIAGYQKVTISHLETNIVPDDFSEIKKVLFEWSGKTHPGTSCYDMIFTTGGTGFSKRDVTPEATLAVLERECRGLMSWAGLMLTARQPLATLSRAAAGICGNSIIVNLPGNPSGASEVLELLFPLLLHAIKDFSA